jgi:hypothetical protein
VCYTFFAQGLQNESIMRKKRLSVSPSIHCIAKITVKDSYLTVELNVRLPITPTEHEAKIESIRFCKNGLQNKNWYRVQNIGSLGSKTFL